MATYQSPSVVTLTAGEDLRNCVNHLLTFENDNGIMKVIQATAPTQVAVGVLNMNPRGDVSTDGLSVPVALLSSSGPLPMRAGGNVTAGQLLVSDTDAGRVVGVANLDAIAAKSMAVGVALESAADGEYFNALPFIMSGTADA